MNVEWERGAIMTLEEILAGESKNVEFKENLPEKSIKYMKSVVAFANGTGGKIIFGIADKTREVVGFDKEDVFKKMDAIANAVSDSCEPAIIPDISLQTIDGKTVIVAEISEGRQRPYYIKALGREGGIYVRVAGTTRLADEYMVRELMFEGSNRYFDQALCSGLTITDEEIDAAKLALKNAYITSLDSLASIENFYLSQTFNRETLTPEESAEKIMAVTKEQIIEAAKAVSIKNKTEKKYE